MSEALVVRLRPAGPWRFGSGSGARDENGELYHSDAVYSAATQAMLRLGLLEDWLEATARAESEPAVRFSSFYPWYENTLYVAPPRTVWPPASAAMINLRGARFLPIPAVRTLLAGKELAEDAWMVDGSSLCLMPRGAETRIYRPVVRGCAAVDRLWPGGAAPHRVAGVEFGPNAGLWLLASFAGPDAAGRWTGPLQSAFRMLADSGFGGRRSAGWGCAEQPLFETVQLPEWILPSEESAAAGEADASVEGQEPTPPPVTGYWMLALFCPGAADAVDWERGRYSLITRGGRVESPAGHGALKKNVRMVAEGSVLLSGGEPVGSAPDVAPDGFDHPVYRYGFPVSVPIPVGMAV